jgi:formate-nitrite transporter family protein
VVRGLEATFVRPILAGVPVALLSYMLAAADGTASRILVVFIVGFFLALGPFDHVVVSVLHLLFGLADSPRVSWADVGQRLAVSRIGNFVGDLFLITLTHTAQVKTAGG